MKTVFVCLCVLMAASVVFGEDCSIAATVQTDTGKCSADNCFAKCLEASRGAAPRPEAWDSYWQSWGGDVWQNITDDVSGCDCKSTLEGVQFSDESYGDNEGQFTITSSDGENECTVKVTTNNCNQGNAAAPSAASGAAVAVAAAVGVALAIAAAL